MPDQLERRREYTRKWHKENPDRIRAHRRKWVAKNMKKHLAYQRKYHRKRYEKNRDKYNSSRRAAYAQDCVRQDAAQQRSREFKARLNSGHVPAPDPIYRTIDGTSRRLYRLSEAARLIGCSSMSICKWHSGGWIPEPLFDRRRLYTIHQVNLLREFWAVPGTDHDKRSVVSKFIFDNWEK
jgi:hypothetical protein